MLMVAVTAGLVCDLCRTGMEGLSAGLRDVVIPVMSELVVGVCAFRYPMEACQEGGREIVEILLQSVTEKYLNPDTACVTLHACSSPLYQPQNFTAWVESLYAEPAFPASPPSPSGQTIRVGQVTDPHIDFAYAPGSSSQCDESICCESRFGTNGTTAGYWGDYDCDLPAWTFESALQSLSEQPLDFLIYTGDSASHSVMNQTVAGKLYSNEQVALRLAHYFPIPIYPVLGNNDGNPAEEFNFQDPFWLTTPLAALYKTALGPEAMESFRLTGSYSQIHRNSSLRIIALNTQACKNINFYLIPNITDPGAQIAFLQSQLALAESQGERVFILGHIPPGADDCMSDWAERYNAVVGRYAEVVTGQFFGHTHSDQFYVGKDYRTGETVTVQWVAPSVTTLSDRNPSYRVYDVDSGDFQLLDFHQYRLDLPLANAHNTTTWSEIYSFKDLYTLPNLNITSISTLVNQLSSDSSLARMYLENYNAGGPGSPAGCSSGCLAALHCSIVSPVYRDYLTCTNSTMSRMNRLMESLQGPWTSLVPNQ